ncbi:MAG: leucyl aminopeptidase [Idiomarina sp.]|nr:leucyl aminopeptidase [Idiomarina sp.]
MKFKASLKALAFAGALAGMSSTASAQFENPFVTSYLNTTYSVSQSAAERADTLVLPVPEGAEVVLSDWSTNTREHVQRALAAADFTGRKGQQATILAPAGLNVDRLIVIGVGDPSDVSRADVETYGAALAATINRSSAEAITVDGRLISNPVYNGRILAALSHGVELRNYRFDRLMSAPSARPAQNYHWRVASRSQAQSEFAELQALAQGVFLARELTNLPGSDGYPAAFAEYARQALEPLGVEVTILGPEEVKALGMGALYGVSQGSQHKAHLLVAHYRGSDQRPIALVGKGNTFDTGGYNLKTDAASILRMQTDKAGGAAVVGAVKALAGQRATVNVVGVVPLSLNMISGEAYLPGDVVTTGSGLTIEVANTDAEGRLILADGLWYAREHFNPRAMADIATLTGAKVTAVGTAFSAIFSEHDTILRTLTEAGELTQERVWRLPLDPAFEGAIESRIADMKNTGAPGASAGAMLLQRFVGDTPWVHIDMAGNALVDGDSGIHPRGATGYGVRMLTEWVKRYPEE